MPQAEGFRAGEAFAGPVRETTEFENRKTLPAFVQGRLAFV
jgi:hypothetical protein